MPSTPPPDTRDRIVVAAAQRFARHGYEAASLSDIAADAGCSKAAALYHFRSKAAILRTLMEPPARELAALVAAVDQLSDPAAAARASAHGFTALVLAWRSELMSYPAGLRQVVTIPELADLQLEALGMRLAQHLNHGDTSTAARLRASIFLGGSITAAQELADAPAAELHAALISLAHDMFHLAPAPTNDPE